MVVEGKQQMVWLYNVFEEEQSQAFHSHWKWGRKPQSLRLLLSLLSQEARRNLPVSSSAMAWIHVYQQAWVTRFSWYRKRRWHWSSAGPSSPGYSASGLVYPDSANGRYEHRPLQTMTRNSLSVFIKHFLSSTFVDSSMNFKVMFLFLRSSWPIEEKTGQWK